MSLLVLCVFVFGLCPVPVGWTSGDDIGSNGKASSQPFPCQHRTCGCRTAAQCWKKCCCFTNTQKVAWAKRNNVPVPAIVWVNLQAEADALCHAPGQKLVISRPVSLVVKTPVGANQAQHHSQPQRHSAGMWACCQHRSASKRADSESPQVKPMPAEGGNAQVERAYVPTLVLAIQAQGCRGEAPPAMALPWYIPPGEWATAGAIPEMCDADPPRSDRLLSSIVAPPVPPPRLPIAMRAQG